MINISIVEDNMRDALLLSGFLERLLGDNGLKSKITINSGEKGFFSEYKEGCDVVFFDIELKDDNGFEISKSIREIDKNIIIVFVTNLTQYALKGYEVSALDFLVKPIDYDVFALKMRRMVEILKARQVNEYVSIKTSGGLINCPVNSIRYVEVVGHMLKFHTVDGDYETYLSLKSLEKQIQSSLIVKSNSGFLVNLKYIRGIKGFDLILDNGEVLPISRTRKTPLLKAMNKYMTAGN